MARAICEVLGLVWGFGRADIGGNGAFDGIFREGNTFVVVEGKLSRSPVLNAANPVTGNPAQMSKDWIEKNVLKAVKEMEGYDSQLAGELRKAYAEGRIKGMVVKTTIDGAGNALDPEFVVKELSNIGQTSF